MKLQKETWLPEQVQAKLRELRGKKPPKVRPVFLLLGMFAGAMLVILTPVIGGLTFSDIFTMWLSAILLVVCMISLAD